MEILAARALLEEGWAQDVRICIRDGVIDRIEKELGPQPSGESVDILVAGMPNLHSHAFQRAMAGLAEVRGTVADSFWSWRSLMYQLALTMTPDQMEAVAAKVYMEMLEAGFTRVGEFHYLHHDKDGRAYANIAEHAERIAEAAADTGINLTLLPVFYAHSNFGGVAPVDGQRRFIHTLDAFSDLMEASERAIKPLRNSNLGLALHSLRAVTPAELQRLVERHGDGPIHIHIAEQAKEVSDCLAWSGARPVEWLLANAPVDARWCLIHATHMTQSETLGMAASGALAGLCPITEANLGDGIFPAETFLQAAGNFGIGSDSNISISVAHELRQLEYSQRLRAQARNVIAEPGQSTGRKLYEKALLGGNAALGHHAVVRPGAAADLVSLRADAVFVRHADQLLDHWIFGDGVTVDSVWAAGIKCVADGRHIARDVIVKRFRLAMETLMDC